MLDVDDDDDLATAERLERLHDAYADRLEVDDGDFVNRFFRLTLKLIDEQLFDFVFVSLGAFDDRATT